jgi:hypothetical protein
MEFSPFRGRKKYGALFSVTRIVNFRILYSKQMGERCYEIEILAVFSASVSAAGMQYVH